MKYEFIGWCKEDKHDKVWGVICLQQPNNKGYWEEGRYVVFWGRRGAKLQTKMLNATAYQVHQMLDKKRDKGYKQILKDELDQVYPEFERDLEKTAIFAMFKL